MGCTLLHRPLKYKVPFLLPNCCVICHQTFSTWEANNSVKLSITLNCVLKHTNNLKTISNWLVLLSTWFRNLKPFLVKGNCSQTRQTRNRGIINILLTLSSWSTLWVTDPRFFPPAVIPIYGPCTSCSGHKYILTRCLAQVEDGCLAYPGASTETS